MNIALAWLRTTQLNSTNTLRYWYVDSFPDLEACLRDPNRYIDQKFIDWVIGRDSREPPADYPIDMPTAGNICNVKTEFDASANRMWNTKSDCTEESESYFDGRNKTEDFQTETSGTIQENVGQRNDLLDENDNLDENRSRVKALGELERVDAKKSQRRSRRTRNLKRLKKSNSCVSRPKHQFLEVPKSAYRPSNSSKICMPLREIQAAPHRMCAEESSSLSTLRGKSQTKSSKFAFNVSVFRCTVNGCGKLYRRRSHLQSHVRRHTGERPFPCTWQGCKWKFSRSDELVRHTRSHSGDKPFNCTTCSKRFARSDHLKKHLRVHLKDLIG